MMQSAPPSTAVNGEPVRRSLSAVALAGLLALAGCSSGDSTDPAASSTATAPAPLHDDHDAAPAPASPTWDDAAAADAWTTAIGAMRAFGRPDVDAEVWYEELAGHLTAAGQQAFYGVDPATVPVRAVAAATVAPNVSPYLAEVVVDTDAGPYWLQLVREGAGEPWRVDRLEPLQ